MVTLINTFLPIKVAGGFDMYVGPLTVSRNNGGVAFVSKLRFRVKTQQVSAGHMLFLVNMKTTSPHHHHIIIIVITIVIDSGQSVVDLLDGLIFARVDLELRVE